VLCVLAILGFLGLEESWSVHVRPEVMENLSQDVFAVVDRVVESILTERRGLWLTFGAAFATWQVSSVVRAASGPLNALYEVDEDRHWLKRWIGSVLLALVVLPCFALAVVGVTLGGEILSAIGAGGIGGVLLWILRWGLVVALLTAVVWLVLRLAPAHRPEVRFVSLGSGIVVAGWVLATLGFGVYVSEIASYADVFGSLAGAIVLMTYLYLLAVVFLGGAQVDLCLRRRIDDGATPAGD
jgi:membrane protein